MNCKIANEIRFGAKLVSNVPIIDKTIDTNMLGLLPLVSAIQPQKYDETIIAEITELFLNFPLLIIHANKLCFVAGPTFTRPVLFSEVFGNMIVTDLSS